MTPDATVTEYRTALAEVDARLLRLYAERRRLVAELMLYKRRAGLPAFDLTQEARVLERARREGGEVGLPAAEAEGLVRWMLERVHAETPAFEAPRATGPTPHDGRPSAETALRARRAAP